MKIDSDTRVTGTDTRIISFVKMYCEIYGGLEQEKRERVRSFGSGAADGQDQRSAFRIFDVRIFAYCVSNRKNLQILELNLQCLLEMLIADMLYRLAAWLELYPVHMRQNIHENDKEKKNKKIVKTEFTQHFSN